MNDILDWISNITISDITAFFTVIILYLSLKSANKLFLLQQRPYVGIKESHIKKTFDKTLEAVLHINNTGNVPANNVVLSIKEIVVSETKEKSEKNEFGPAIIFPNNEIHLRTILIKVEDFNEVVMGISKWKIELIISYNGIKTKNHKTIVLLEYDPGEDTFSLINGNAK